MNERPVTSEVNFPYKEDVGGSIPSAPTLISDSTGLLSTGSDSTLRISERQESGRRTAIPAKIKRDVLSSGVCTYCGEDNFRMTIDHVTPVSQGGTNDPANLTSACWPCNQEKLSFTLEEWKAWRAETGKPWPPQSKTAFIAEHIQAYLPQWRAEKAAERLITAPVQLIPRGDTS